MALDEIGSGLLRVFELTDLSGKTRPLAFEKPSVRFGRALPGTLGRLQPGATGLDVRAASMPDEESAAGILDATEVLLVDSAREFQALVTFSDGSNLPPPGAGAEGGEVRFERGLLFVDVSKPVGDARRDARDRLLVLGTQLDETLGGSGLVGGPLLASLVIPRPHETLGGLNEVRCGGVNVAGVPGSAHGHIGEFPATTIVEDVGDFDRRSLGAMSGDGVAVGEAVRDCVLGAHV